MPAITALGRSRLYDYAHETPPPGFVTVARAGTLSIPGNTANNGVEATGAKILIPIQMVGWIRWLGIFLGSSNATFSIFQGGAPLRDYMNINASMGAPATPVTSYIQLNPAQALQVYAGNSGGTAAALQFYLFGWYYPVSRTDL